MAYENAEEWEDMFRFNEAPARRRGKCHLLQPN